jgi:hypothetical protein
MGGISVFSGDPAPSVVFPSRNKPTSFHPSVTFSPEEKTLGGMHCCLWGNWVVCTTCPRLRPRPAPCEGRPAGRTRGDALSTHEAHLANSLCQFLISSIISPGFLLPSTKRMPKSEHDRNANKLLMPKPAWQKYHSET